MRTKFEFNAFLFLRNNILKIRYNNDIGTLA